HERRRQAARAAPAEPVSEDEAAGDGCDVTEWKVEVGCGAEPFNGSRLRCLFLVEPVAVSRAMGTGGGGAWRATSDYAGGPPYSLRHAAGGLRGRRLQHRLRIRAHF